MPLLHILCYNGSLVTWKVVSLTAAKFKALIFSTSDFALSLNSTSLAPFFYNHFTLTEQKTSFPTIPLFCLRTRCRRNLFTESLHSNGRLRWFHYSVPLGGTSQYYEVPHYYFFPPPVTSSLFGSIIPSALFLKHPQFFSSLMFEIKFHTRTRSR
jgi:hypothetical protein